MSEKTEEDLAARLERVELESDRRCFDHSLLLGACIALTEYVRGARSATVEVPTAMLRNLRELTRWALDREPAIDTAYYFGLPDEPLDDAGVPA